MKGRIKKIDLFIIIGCIIFLIAALSSVGKKGQELGKRMVCAGNQGQILTGIINYANEYAGKVPEPVIPGYPDDHYMGNWPWDGRYGVVNEILENMGINISNFQPQPEEIDPIPSQPVFYCPANEQQKRFLKTNWSYAIGLGLGGRPDGYRVLGYAFLWTCSWNGFGSLPIRGGMKETDPPDPTKKWVDSVYIENPSETELIVDATLSERIYYLTGKAYDLNLFPNGNFAFIASGGNPYMYGAPDQSSHLKNVNEPYGGNIGFVDGHVEWRNFKDMRNRFGNGQNMPMWWW
jgi:prepilin-type processing-associated H-X9-DG protein